MDSMGTCPLIDLPSVPLLHILRYLGNCEHVKLLKTCRTMKRIINDNRATRKVHKILVKRTDTTFGPLLTALSIYYIIDVTVPVLRKFDIDYHWDKSDPNSHPFFVWFAETFAKTDIEELILENFNFFDEKPGENGYDYSWRECGIQIELLRMKESILADGENCVQFLQATGQKSVVIEQNDVTKAHALVNSKSFPEWLSSLESIAIIPICVENRTTTGKKLTKQELCEIRSELRIYYSITLPYLTGPIERLPPVCRLSFACIVKFEVIKRELHRWYREGGTFGMYHVSLPNRFRHNEWMVEEIDLPGGLRIQYDDPRRHIELWRDETTFICMRRTGNYGYVSYTVDWVFYSEEEED